MADDYFAAMERVEQRLEIVPAKENDAVVNVQEAEKVFQLIDRLKTPEICLEERLGIVCQLREWFGAVATISNA